MDKMSSYPALYLPPNDELLKKHFIGRDIRQVAAPAAVIDVSKARSNCRTMLEVVKNLQVEFRAHIKTHKTVELTELQIGDEGDIRLVVSTVAELEHLIPWLLDCLRLGRIVDVLYGVPPSPMNLERLQNIKELLVEHSKSLSVSPKISVLVDNFSCPYFELSTMEESRRLHFFIKIDSGYERAGVKTDPQNSQEFQRILERIKGNTSLEENFVGLYTHYGSSYNANSSKDAMEGLLREIQMLHQAASTVRTMIPLSKLLISAGATPTTTAAQNILSSDRTDGAKPELRQILEKLKQTGIELELHAGVYPLLDLQQLATRARPEKPLNNFSKAHLTGLSQDELGLRILADVVSLYHRNGKHEALIAAGTLALGREPCKSYPGWGVIAPWNPDYPVYTEKTKTGWIVGRISQEHGILTWEGDEANFKELQIGDRVAVWPNHACVAGAMFDWYLIVDSESDDKNIIRDVWPRCRGW